MVTKKKPRKTTRTRPSKKSARRRPTRTKAAVGGRVKNGDLVRVSVADLQAEIDRRLRTLDDRRAKLVAQLDAIENEMVAYNGAVAARRATLLKTRRVRKRPRNRTNLVSALKEVLTDRTLSVTEMSVAVQKGGYRTTSPNFRTIVNQTLINNKQAFKRVARGCYTARAAAVRS